MGGLIYSIAGGLIIWLVVPMLTNAIISNHKLQNAIELLCKIIGIVIIIVAVLDFFALRF